MAKYLLTGGAGFIGSNIAERLLNDGDQVRVIDNFSTGCRENIADFLDRIELIEGDICKMDDVSRAWITCCTSPPGRLFPRRLQILARATRQT